MSTLIGFCTVDVRPGLDGGDHGERVPVIGSVNEDDVQILCRKHLAIVRKRSRSSWWFRCRAATISAASSSIRESTSQRAVDFDRGDLDEPEQVTFSVPTAADQPHARRPSGLRLLSVRRRRQNAGSAWRRENRVGPWSLSLTGKMGRLFTRKARITAKELPLEADYVHSYHIARSRDLLLIVPS